MNLTLVRLLFRPHPEMSKNDRIIDSIVMAAFNKFLESVVHYNSSTQMAIPTINERTGRLLMDVLRGDVPPLPLTSTWYVRVAQRARTQASGSVNQWRYLYRYLPLKLSATT